MAQMFSLITSRSNLGLSKWSREMLLVGGACLAGTIAVICFMRRNKEKKLLDSSGSTERVEDEGLLTGLNGSQRIKKKGNDLFKDLKYDEAVKAFTKAIALCPENEKKHLSVCYQNRAAAYEKIYEQNTEDKQPLKEVINDCTKALDLDSAYVKAAVRRAKTNKRLGNFKEALEDFTYASILDSQSVMSYKDDFDSVVTAVCEEFIDNLAEPGGCIPVRMELVLLWRSCYINDPVVKDLKTVFGKETPYKLALNAIREHRYEDVISYVEEDISSGQVDASESLRDFILITKFALMKEKVDTMKIYLDKFARLWAALDEDTKNTPINKHYIASYYLLCAGLKYLMKSPISKEDIKKAIDADENNVDVYLGASMLLSEDGQLSLALEYLEQLAKMDPKHHLVNHLKAIYEIKLRAYAGDYAGALSAIVKADELLKANPNADPILYILTGKLYFATQNIELAKASFQKAAELLPDYSAPIFHLAVLDASEMEDSEKMDAFEEKIKFCLEKEQDPDALGILAKIALQRQDFDKAEELFLKGIRASPFRRNQETLRQLLIPYVQLLAYRSAFEKLKRYE